MIQTNLKIKRAARRLRFYRGILEHLNIPFGLTVGLKSQTLIKIINKRYKSHD